MAVDRRRADIGAHGDLPPSFGSIAASLKPLPPAVSPGRREERIGDPQKENGASWRPFVETTTAVVGWPTSAGAAASHFHHGCRIMGPYQVAWAGGRPFEQPPTQVRNDRPNETSND